jgi:hypothetical protein
VFHEGSLPHLIDAVIPNSSLQKGLPFELDFENENRVNIKLPSQQVIEALIEIQW